MVLFGINLYAVLAGVASVFILGGLWYSVIFGKAWTTAANLEGTKRLPAGIVYGSTLVMNILSAVAFGALVADPIRAGWALGAGVLAGMVFGGFSLAIHYLGAGRRLSLLAIDGAFQVVRFTLFGLAFQLFR